MITVTWYKRFHGTAYDPKFTAAGEDAGSTHCNALAVWDALLEETSGNEADRGSLAKVDFRVVAAGLRLPIDEVKRIFEAFVSLGMIVGERISAWVKRQGAAATAAAARVAKRVATSSTPRVRAYRERRKAAAGQLDLGLEAAAVSEAAVSCETDPPVTRVSPRVSRVTSGVSPPFPPAPPYQESNQEIPPLCPPRGAGIPHREFENHQVELLMPIRGGRDGRRRETARERRMREYKAAMAAAVLAARNRRMAAAGVD